MYSQERLVDLQENAQRLLEQLASSYYPFSLQLPLSGGVDFIFARNSFSLYWVSVSICAITLSGLYAVFSRRYPTRRDRVSECRQVLQALLYFLTPTRSIWPQPYVSLVQKAIGAGRNTLRLPLGVLVDDVLDGWIELRAPKLDLPGLQRNAFPVDGWTFGLRVEWALWIDMLAWALTARMVPSKSGVSAYTGLLDFRVIDGFAPTQDYFVKIIGASQQSSATSAQCAGRPPLPGINCTTFPPTVSLDEVAYTHMEPSINDLQLSLVPGRSLTLIFTTAGTSVSFLSRNFVLAALQFFLSRGYSHSLKSPDISRRQRGPWVPAPLFSSLPQIVHLLASGPNPLAIDSILNISEAHATSLNAYVQDLEENKTAMERTIKEWGVAVWRAERFFASWESACLTNKLLERWAVVVRKL